MVDETLIEDIENQIELLKKRLKQAMGHSSRIEQIIEAIKVSKKRFEGDDSLNSK